MTGWDFPLLLNFSGYGLLKLSFRTDPDNYIFHLALLVSLHSCSFLKSILQLRSAKQTAPIPKNQKFLWSSQRMLCLSFEPPEKPGIRASTMNEGWPGVNDGDIIPSSGRNICHSSALAEAFQDSGGS